MRPRGAARPTILRAHECGVAPHTLGRAQSSSAASPMLASIASKSLCHASPTCVEVKTELHVQVCHLPASAPCLPAAPCCSWRASRTTPRTAVPAAQMRAPLRTACCCMRVRMRAAGSGLLQSRIGFSCVHHTQAHRSHGLRGHLAGPQPAAIAHRRQAAGTRLLPDAQRHGGALRPSGGLTVHWQVLFVTHLTSDAVSLLMVSRHLCANAGGNGRTYLSFTSPRAASMLGSDPAHVKPVPKPSCIEDGFS